MATYELSWLLPHVREAVRGASNFNFDQYVDRLFYVLLSRNTPTIEKTGPNQGYSGRVFNFDVAHQDIRFAATEAFYYMEHNRFILRAPPTNTNAFLPHGQFQVTARGREWAEGVEPLPEDYNGYMAQFGPSADAVVRQYISEALNTFIRGTYFASAVMIGAASEKTIYLLSDSLVPALKNPADKTQLQRQIDARRLEPLLKLMEQIVIDGHAKRTIPFSVMGGTTRHLLCLFDSIRLQRNDAIHPLNFTVSVDSVRAALNIFPMAFAKVDALRAWCSKNSGCL